MKKYWYNTWPNMTIWHFYTRFCECVFLFILLCTNPKIFADIKLLRLFNLFNTWPMYFILLHVFFYCASYEELGDNCDKVAKREKYSQYSQTFNIKILLNEFNWFKTLKLMMIMIHPVPFQYSWIMCYTMTDTRYSSLKAGCSVLFLIEL